MGRSLAEQGLTLLSRVQSLALVEQACAEALTETSYFGRLRDRPGLHRAVQSTLDELREAGVTADNLPDEAFTHPGKVADVRSILRSNRDVEVLMAEVTGFDLERRIVHTQQAEIAYDYLIVAAGARHEQVDRDQAEKNWHENRPERLDEPRDLFDPRGRRGLEE